MTKQQIKSFKSKMQCICDYATDVLDTIEAHKVFAKKKHKSIESIFNDESIEYFLGKSKQMHDKCDLVQLQLESILQLSHAMKS